MREKSIGSICVGKLENPFPCMASGGINISETLMVALFACLEEEELSLLDEEP